MTRKPIPDDDLLQLVNVAKAVAIELVAQINERTINNKHYCLFSDITASYVLAYSYLATYLQSTNNAEPSFWKQIKEAAHESLDIAFRSVEKNLPLYEEKLRDHANH